MRLVVERLSPRAGEGGSRAIANDNRAVRRAKTLDVFKGIEN